jgi:hypothetical protein
LGKDDRSTLRGRLEVKQPLAVKQLIDRGQVKTSFPSDIPDVIQSIRAAIETIPMSSEGIYSLSCDADWEVVQYCQRRLSGSYDLHKVITLTGTLQCAKAASCQDYVAETWNQQGQKLLNAFMQGLPAGNFLLESSPDYRLNIKFLPLDQVRTAPERAHIQLSGTLDELVRTISQLAWFGSVFSLPEGNSLTMSYANFHRVSGTSFKLSLLKKKQEVSNGDLGMCWVSLFNKGILACGFPVTERAEGEGLEIPFPLMAIFAKVSVSMDYDGGTILVGPSSFLLPVERFHDAVQWHYVEATDACDIINVLNASPGWVREPHIGNITKLRTFLGFCTHALVFLGTEELVRETTISNSGLPNAKSRIELAREGTTSAGFSVQGIVNGTIGGKWLLPRGLETPLFENREYEDRLMNACDRPLLLHDLESKTAWLVSELSLVLHMALTFLNQKRIRQRWHRRNNETPEPQLPYVQASYNSGDGAYQKLLALKDEVLYTMSDGKDKKVWSVIDDFLKDLSVLRMAMNVRRTSSGWKLSKSRLQGWEFTDLISKSDYVCQKEVPSEDLKSSWWRLGESTNMLVIFGNNFGQVIRPDFGKTKPPYGWKSIPTDAELLTASIPCVKELAKQAILHIGTIRNSHIIAGLVWYRPRNPRKKCNKYCNGYCHIIQEIRCVGWLRRWSSINGPGKLNENGAVVFGNSKVYHESLAREFHLLRVKNR